jgi:hypothetical protein
MGVHVFEEDPPGLAFPDDPGDVRPEVARVLFGPLFSGATERLARVARAEDIDLSLPGAAVERLNVAPNWRRTEGSVFKARNQPLRDSDFPFHVADGSNFAASES